MSFTDWMENAVLNGMLGTGHALGLPATVYIGLSTTSISDDGSGYTEPVGGAYAKVAKTNSNTDWTVSVAGEKTNATDCVFPDATADWGIVTDWFVSDVGISQIYVKGKLDDGAGTPQPRTILNGDTFKFLAGDLRIVLD